jgi:hypothetical protein
MGATAQPPYFGFCLGCFKRRVWVRKHWWGEAPEGPNRSNPDLTHFEAAEYCWVTGVPPAGLQHDYTLDIGTSWIRLGALVSLLLSNCGGTSLTLVVLLNLSGASPHQKRRYAQLRRLSKK